MTKIKILTAAPSEPLRTAYIDPSDAALSQTVDGEIECLPITSRIYIISREESWTSGLPVSVLGFRGKIAFVGFDGGQYVSLTDEQIHWLEGLVMATTAVKNEDTCVCCGATVPEGRCICGRCEIGGIL